MIRVLNLVVRDVPLERPFLSVRCNNAGAATVFDGFLGGMFGMATTDMTNQINKQIAADNVAMQKETNEQNYQMFKEQQAYDRQLMKEQQAWNESMWDKQNAYNTPSAQVQRLQAAGINPAFGMGASGNNGSPVSSVSSPQTQRAQMVAPRNDYRAIPYDLSSFGNIAGEAINAYYQAKLMNAAVSKNEADANISKADAVTRMQKNLSDLAESRARIDKLLADKNLSSEQRDYYQKLSSQIGQQMKLIDTQWNDLAVKEYKQNAYTDALTNQAIADSQLKRLQGEYQSILNEYAPMLQAAGVSLTFAQIKEATEHAIMLAAQGELTSKQAFIQQINNELGLDELKKQMDKSKIRNSNKFFRRLFNSTEVLSESVLSGLKGIIRF